MNGLVPSGGEAFLAQRGVTWLSHLSRTANSLTWYMSQSTLKSIAWARFRSEFDASEQVASAA
jgi:hypothetical protein